MGYSQRTCWQCPTFSNAALDFSTNMEKPHLFLQLKEDKSPFKLAYKSLKYAGIMNQEGRPWSLVYTTVMVLGISCLTVLSIADLIWGQEELPEFVSALSTLTITIHGSSKMINILSNQTEIRQLINRFENVRQKFLQDNRRKHLVLWADQFSLKVAFYYGMFFGSCVLFSTILNMIIGVFTGSEKPHLVLQLWVPWRIRDVETHLGATLLSIVCTVPSASVYTAFSVFNFIFTIELSAFLQVLQSRFETLKMDDKEVYQQHKEIIKLLRDYNEIFSGQLYVEIIISTLQPCGFGYTFIKALQKLSIQAIDYIFKFVVTAVSPFMLCACGQEISTQLEKLHTSCYMCNWYEEKPASRRYLGQLMTVTLKPIAFNFRRMVAQGIYSYLMMVYQFEEGD
ncbi:odorant receptor 47a-like isoform X2 [Rhodnius prolixus]|uniref:odorant receptor 47a-like isoform X2 n=1 Tax=Rhodnius prolixus TaxID=13249 RepID=UPI003D18BCC6